LATVNERAIAFVIMFWRLCEIVILFAWVGWWVAKGETEKKADRQWALYLTTFLISYLIMIDNVSAECSGEGNLDKAKFFANGFYFILLAFFCCCY